MRRALAALAVAAIVGCSPPPAAPPTVGDETVDRIVVLAPHLAELAFAAGAGGELVGVSAYTDYPPEAAELPSVGDAFTVDIERLRLLEPDLVLAWESGMPAHTIDGLKRAGFRVETIRTRNLADVVLALKRIGQLTGRDAEAEAEADRFRAAIASLERQFESARPVRVFFQVSARPLYTINGDHFISELLEACGGENVFADLTELAPAVDVEAVLSRNPEAVVAGSATDELSMWSRFDGLLAAQYDNLLTVDAEHLARASTRLDDAGARLCSVIDTARRRLPAPR